MRRLAMAACFGLTAVVAQAKDAGAAGGVIPVTDRNVLNGLSPYNWVCRDDYISTTVCGASLAVGFKGTGQVALKVDMEHVKNATASAKRYPVIAWSVNGGACQSHQFAPGETTVLLASGVRNPEIDLHVKGMSPFEERYQGDVPGTALKITGFAVDAGGAAKAVPLPRKVWLNIGDSIMSGDGAAYVPGQGRPNDDLWAESDDGRASYGYLLARHYGYREARIAYGGYDWAGGMAGVPGVSTLIDQKTSTVRRTDGDALRPAPDVVLINLGENGVPADKDVVDSLSRIRSRAGSSARMVVMIPVSGKGRAEIARAFNAYKTSAGDASAYLVGLGHVEFATCDGQHPEATGHQAIFKAALPAFDAIVNRPGKASGAAGLESAKTAFPEPFWKSKMMENEPILFVQEGGKPVAEGKLLFVPLSKPVIMHPDLKTAYVEGKDYIWKRGTDRIELTPGSQIPFKTAAQMLPPNGSPNSLGGVLWSEGHFFHDLQVQASYKLSGTWALPPPARKSPLARSLGKLRAGQPFKIVALGDSITEGYNASGCRKVSAPPYQPAYPELVADVLKRRFSAAVSVVNLGVAGTRADWGISQVAKVTAEKPDLVILAFGMNHNEGAPDFDKTMGKLLAGVQAGSPQADVVLVAGMTGNPRMFPPERFIGYRDALRKLESTSVAVADVTSPWLELLKRKPFSDLSGNNVNHPNDFGHRVYAHVICDLFPAKKE